MAVLRWDYSDGEEGVLRSPSLNDLRFGVEDDESSAVILQEKPANRLFEQVDERRLAHREKELPIRLKMSASNRIPVPLAQQTDAIARPVHDDGEQLGDVAAQNAHVQGFEFRDSGELAVERNAAAIFSSELDR